ncbi:hypothetical protein DFR58_12122 [Anaerobacterium chartisolvens]|uniref:Uncharacterized protein n=1 Tax=Anaerobacterium chartisolvens TaxID=1297424 RepID=A0A369AVZ7_9FIRM|nr:hypothetical protein [Anaerobacterium chartisolvens]RCX12518.1 hypothetical protein DFR58_12122 [Anaerobacterium chartisolvens]
MLPKTNSSIYSRPVTHNTPSGSKDKDYHMRAYTLSNELNRLEYEKKMAELRMVRVEKRIDEIQKEIHLINTYFKEQCEVPQNTVTQPPKTKHVTFEY